MFWSFPSKDIHKELFGEFSVFRGDLLEATVKGQELMTDGIAYD